jgi:hypothetical protein
LTLAGLRVGGFYGSAVVPAILLLLAGILFAAPGGREGPGRLVLSGLLTTAAALFRHDFGAYGFVAVLATRFVGRAPVLPYVLTVVGTMVPLVGALLWTAGWGPVIDQLVVFPFSTFPEYRDLPFAEWSHALAPPALGLAAGAWGWRAIRAGDVQTGTTAVMASMTGLLLLGQSQVRSDFAHMFPAFAMIVLAAAIAAAGIWRTRRFAARAVLMACFLPLTWSAISARPPAGAPATHAFALDRARGLWSTEDAEHYEAVITRVRQLTDAGSPIFVGNDRHDRLFINDALFYFLANRRNATRYNELHPGVATTGAVQLEIIQDILARDVRVVVIRTERHPLELHNQSSRSSGITRLDDFLRRTFVVRETYGDYEIWRR